MVLDWARPTTIQSASAATGNGDVLAINNYGGALLAISGTFVGTVTFEGSSDNSSFFAIPALNMTTSSSATTATVPGLYFISAPGVTYIRARVSAYTSGSITVVVTRVPLTAAAGDGVATTVPAGAATENKQDTQITAEQAIQALLGGTGSLKDNGPAWSVTQTYATSANTTSPLEITASPDSGKRVIANDIVVSTDTAMSIIIEDEDGTDIGQWYFAANQTIQITMRDGLRAPAINKKLQVLGSTAGNVSVTCSWRSAA